MKNCTEVVLGVHYFYKNGGWIPDTQHLLEKTLTSLKKKKDVNWKLLWSIRAGEGTLFGRGRVQNDCDASLHHGEGVRLVWNSHS